MSTAHDAALRALFPDSPPEWVPELVRLEFANSDPDDYQSTVTVGAEDLPVYQAAPALADALRALLDYAEHGDISGRGRTFAQLKDDARAALAAADAAP
jgi:hypothetical protein